MPSIDELAYLNVHFGIEFTSRRIFSMSHLKHIRVIAPLTVFLVILTVVATSGNRANRTDVFTTSVTP